MMEKIFDEDFRNELSKCLQDSGMSNEEVSNIINTRYRQSLKIAIIDRLTFVLESIKKDEYDKIIPLIGDSPAGDGWGCNNRYISFKDITGLEDIGDIIDYLDGSYKI